MIILVPFSSLTLPTHNDLLTVLHDLETITVKCLVIQLYRYKLNHLTLTLRRAENPAGLKWVKRFIKNLICPRVHLSRCDECTEKLM